MKKTITITSMIAVTTFQLSAQSFLGGWDFSNLGINQDNGVLAANIIGGQPFSANLDTTSFSQATEAANGFPVQKYQVGQNQSSTTVGNVPVNGSQAFLNGFSNVVGNPSALGFQGAIGGLSWTLSFDASLFSNIDITFDRFVGQGGAGNSGDGLLAGIHNIDYNIGNGFQSFTTDNPNANYENTTLDFGSLLNGVSNVIIRYTFSAVISDSDGSSLLGQSDDFIGFDNIVITGSAVPEPSTYALTFGALALTAVFAINRRRTKTLELGN